MVCSRPVMDGSRSALANKRSLSVGLGEDGRTLLKCFASGCPPEQIARAVDMSMADRGPIAGNGHRAARPREVCAYDYRDGTGAMLYQVVRFDPKDFRQRRPDGQGGWTWDVKGVRRVVYRLDELTEQRRVFLTEGEKDADRLWSLGIVATTTPGGAAAWRDDYAEQIHRAGADEVIACPDNDEAGRAYVARAAEALIRHSVVVRVLALPGVAPKGDVSDWLGAGHSAEELLALAAAAPRFTGEGPPITGEAPRDDGAAEPELQRQGLDLGLVWSNGVRFSLTAIRDGRDGVRGELTVTQAERRLSWGALALSSTQAREMLRKKLEAVASGLPWGDYLEDAAWRLTRAAREGEPLAP